MKDNLEAIQELFLVNYLQIMNNLELIQAPKVVISHFQWLKYQLVEQLECGQN